MLAVGDFDHINMTVEIPMATLKGQVIRTDKAYQLRFNMAISEDTLAVANGELAVNHGGEALTISLPTMQDDTTIDTVSLVIPSVGGDVTYQVPAGDINTEAGTATVNYDELKRIAFIDNINTATVQVLTTSTSDSYVIADATSLPAQAIQ